MRVRFGASWGDTRSDFPPPGPVGRLERARLWLVARRWRQWVFIPIGFILSVQLLMAMWIGVALLRGSTERNAGAVAANMVLMPFIGILLLLVMHGAFYRWFWHVERRRVTEGLPASDIPEFGKEPTLPPPAIPWPAGLRLRHVVLRLLGMATLLYAFLPYENQRAFARFIVGHSAGRASAGSLNMLIFGYLPIFALILVSMLLLRRQTRRRDAGLLDQQEKLVLMGETNWLFAFACAFGIAALFSRIFGSMIIRYL